MTAHPASDTAASADLFLGLAADLEIDVRPPAKVLDLGCGWGETVTLHAFSARWRPTETHVKVPLAP